MLGVEDVIKNITVHTGQSRGVSPGELRAIWHAMWTCTEHLLAQGKSVLIPNFATISVISVGPVSTLSFQLHPYFTSSHCISSPSDVKSPASGVATAVPLHAAYIEAELQGQIPRHAIVNAVKDVVRHIGLVAGTGRALRLDCNPVMMLNFLNCRANVSFNSRIARVLPTPVRSASEHHPSVTRSEQSASAQPAAAAEAQSVAKALPPAFAPRPPSAPKMPPIVGANSAAAAAAAGAQGSTTNGGNKGSGANTPLGGSTPRASIVAGQQQAPPGTASLTASGRAGNNIAEHISASRGTFSQGSSAARAHNREQRMSVVREVVDSMPNLSKHKKHLLKKNMYRHLRGEVYRNIWEQNQADVSARRAQEAALDKQLMEHLAAVAEHEKAMLDQRDHDRRRTAIETRLTNQKLAPLQKSQQLPRAQDPGEIFYMRSNPLVLQKDTATLRRQIEDRKQREEHERAADRIVAEQAHEEYLRVRQEAIDARKRRAERQIELRAETERIIEDKAVRKAKEVETDRHLARTGGLFFEEGGNIFAERSRAIMRENMALMRQRADEQQRQRATTMRSQGIEFQNQLVEDAAQAVAQRKQDLDVKASMREAWTKQMAERQAKLSAEKRARDTWRDRWNIQNSSSDDDD